MTSRKKEYLQNLLVETGILSREKWERILRKQEETGLKLGEIIRTEKDLSSEEVNSLLELIYDAPIVSLNDKVLQGDAVESIPREIAVRYSLIPMFQRDGVLEVAMSDPDDLDARDLVAFRAGCSLRVFYASPEEIHKAIQSYYSSVGDLRSVASMLIDMKTRESVLEPSDESVETLRRVAEEAPIIRLVNLIIVNAIESRASDIHVEPMQKEIFVQYRIDGILYKIHSIPLTVHPALVSRLKILGGMNIAERRLPQDGRCRIRIRGVEYDLRLSIAPYVHGEKVVIRILGHDMAGKRLLDLGFSADQMARLKRIISRPFGMLFVVGPTGSGKTTTLYSILNEFRETGRNICTVEDPVEYRVEGVNQLQVHSKIGLTFANALRTFLRQDPDVILVGEVRDEETAQIAVQAAMTGHFVMATLHTNDAPSTITRLIDMGVPPYMVASSVTGAVAQRLIRKICLFCKTPLELSAEERNFFETRRLRLPDRVYRGKGCSRCGNRGYMGRTAVYEVMLNSGRISRAVMERADTRQIEAIAKDEGMMSMAQSAMEKVYQGITTVEEVMRVTVTVEEEVI